MIIVTVYSDILSMESMVGTVDHLASVTTPSGPFHSVIAR